MTTQSENTRRIARNTLMLYGREGGLGGIQFFKLSDVF